jgi:glycosyltransferase involved in cell wall biosynthesis
MPTAPPSVSIVVPCRNEEHYIAECLDSILGCDYPQDRLEVLVVDGMSDDGTQRVLADYSTRCPLIRVIDNPRRITPVALNLAIRAARGDIIVRMDAHVVYPRNYVSRLVAALDEFKADNVGAVLRTLPITSGPWAAPSRSGCPIRSASAPPTFASAPNSRGGWTPSRSSASAARRSIASGCLMKS